MAITLVRAIIIYIFITVSVRVMGKRQVGELNPQELVITILISAVATVPLEDNGMPLANSLIPIGIFISLEIINSALSMKSIKFRNIIQGKPIFVIRNGEIQQKELTRLRYTVDDLVDCVRQAGVFDISQVENAIVETNGVISVQKKSEFSPITPSAAGIKTDKADHIKKVIREQSKDFEGKFSDAKIMREYLEGIARNTYYKYKKELVTEYKN